MSNSSILEDYRCELRAARGYKRKGVTTVSALTAGPELSNGRTEVPIDEYIAMWQDGITKMEAGADQEQFNY